MTEQAQNEQSQEQFTSNEANNEQEQEKTNHSENNNNFNKKIANARDGWILAGTYLIGWLVILVIFKLAYNRYQRQKQLEKKKWYPVHPEKDAYEELVAKGEENEEILRKALLRRAMTDVRRVWELQEEKEALHKLTRSGSIPESMLNSYKDADHDMQLEIYDLQAEAETFKPGWSQSILKEAAQLVQRERELQALRARINEETQMRLADPNRSAQEKKTDKKNLLKAQALAEQMINKQYGSDSVDSDSKENEIVEVKSSSEEGEK